MSLYLKIVKGDINLECLSYYSLRQPGARKFDRVVSHHIWPLSFFAGDEEPSHQNILDK